MADTQGEGRNIFRQSAMSRIASADDLDKYIRVTNPSLWMVLLAAVLLLGGLAIWSFTATIPTTINISGIAEENTVYCWVNEETAEKIGEGGARASVGDVEASDIEVSMIPLSDAEIRNEFGSAYVAEALTLGAWNYEVVLTYSNPSETTKTPKIVPVSITVAERHPVNLILGGK